MVKAYQNVIKPMLGITSKLDQDIDIDEGLDPYWNCLSGSEQKVLYTNEVYNRKKLGIK